MSRFTPKRNATFVISHTVLFGVLWLVGAPWAYVLWWVAYVFVHQLVTRLRFIGEHGVALDRLGSDPRDNTCTTLVSLWERLLVAPNYVNYHLEHHLSAAVPCYRLAPLHELLVEKGFYNQRQCLSNGYRDVLSRAIKPRRQEPAAA
jgi:fatty acid desaturase